MIIIISAMTKNSVIGKDNKLPWNIPEEMKHFRKSTSGNTVLMGRKTFEGMGRPLPNRNNIVISRTVSSIEGCDVFPTIEEGIEKAKTYGKDIFIIGGSMIYELGIPYADKMYLSYIKEDYSGDTYFPEFDENEWQVESREDRGSYEFVIYSRKS